GIKIWFGLQILRVVIPTFLGLAECLDCARAIVLPQLPFLGGKCALSLASSNSESAQGITTGRMKELVTIVREPLTQLASHVSGLAVEPTAALRDHDIDLQPLILWMLLLQRKP